jgi:hypothetical protein
MIAAAVILTAGCARTAVENRIDTAATPRDQVAELDFWHALPGRSAVSNDEGLHGVILFGAEEEAPTLESYEDRVAYAKERGWLSKGWDESPATAMQRGTLSRALAVICGVEGGVIMRLLGPTSRYAQRELVFEGIMPASTELQTISGLEYIGVISKAQDYLTVKQARAEADRARSVPASEDGPADAARRGS